MPRDAVVLDAPRYDMAMQRFRKRLVRILLLSVLLNLGDWPYVDEILSDGIPVADQTEAASASDRSGSRGHTEGSDSKTVVGYQLLLPMQGVPGEPARFPSVLPEKASSSEPQFSLYLIPARIDRPPIPSTPS